MVNHGCRFAPIPNCLLVVLDGGFKHPSLGRQVGETEHLRLAFRARAHARACANRLAILGDCNASAGEWIPARPEEMGMPSKHIHGRNSFHVFCLSRFAWTCEACDVEAVEDVSVFVSGLLLKHNMATFHHLASKVEKSNGTLGASSGCV